MTTSRTAGVHWTFRKDTSTTEQALIKDSVSSGRVRKRPGAGQVPTCNCSLARSMGWKQTPFCAWSPEDYQPSLLLFKSAPFFWFFLFLESQPFAYRDTRSNWLENDTIYFCHNPLLFFLSQLLPPDEDGIIRLVAHLPMSTQPKRLWYVRDSCRAYEELEKSDVF